MFVNYLKITLRLLMRQKLYAMINIVGLAVGVACCVLIYLFVRHEWTYDAFHKKSDRIYRVDLTMKQPNGDLHLRGSSTPAPLALALKTSFHEVVRTVRLSSRAVDVRTTDRIVSSQVLFADPDFLQVFTFPLLSGNTDQAFSKEEGLILTASAARRFFGATDPIGKPLTLAFLSREKIYTVAGVVADVPGNSSLRFDMVVPFEHCVYTSNVFFQNGMLTEWNRPVFTTFVELAEDAPANLLEKKLIPFIPAHWGENTTVTHMDLQPLIRMRHDTSVTSDYTTRDPLYSYILTGIALIVLTLALINYTTLAIGRYAGRKREVGLRKVMGAHRSQLIGQFWGEATLIVAFAFLLGVVLAELALPAFNALAQTSLTLHTAAFDTGVFFIGLIVLVGLVAGAYPALALSRFQPAAALKGRPASAAGRPWLTRTLVALQFTMAVALLISALVMSRQLNFMQTSDLGFDKSLLMVIEGPKRGEMDALFKGFQKEIRSYHAVIHSSTTSLPFGGKAFPFAYSASDGSRIPVQWAEVGPGFPETMRIEVVQGEGLLETQSPGAVDGPVLVNEAFARAVGNDFAFDKPFELGVPNTQFKMSGMKVVGVIRDFHTRSLRYPVEPLVLSFRPDDVLYTGATVILARIAPQAVQETIRYFEETWKRLAPGYPFVYAFVDDLALAEYREDARWTAIIRYASILAILITCIGLFGLVTLATTQRTREIGIRKVLGASVSSIVALYGKEFTLLALLANLFAWPMAYFALSRWLANYAYRIEIGPGLFLFGGALTLLLTWLTLSYQTIRAARMNPVETLRYE